MNLAGVATLIIDPNRASADVMSQLLRGFGVYAPEVAANAAAARSLLEGRTFDLCLCDLDLPGGSGEELIRWVRRLKTPARFTPIVALLGYAPIKNVAAARDAGAQTVVKKPASARVLYDHIAWAASPARPFIEAAGYVGPDRRFKFGGTPDGVGRRADDLPPEIGEATEPNMSQAEIDAMMKPMQIAVP